MPKASPHVSRLVEKTESLGKEVKTKIFGYIAAAFGLVAGLAWNDAIKALIDTYFPQGEGDVLAKFVYAIIISLVVVTISVYVSQLSKKDDTKK